MEIAVMFKIVRFPEKVKPFFESLDDLFHWDHAEYFRTLVLLIVFAWGRRNIASLCRHLDEQNWHHRSRFNNFLKLLRWPAQQALQMKASELIKYLRPKPGDTLLLILDDSKKQKRGKHMQAVGWIKDPLSGRTIKGHQFLAATIFFQGHTIPFGIRLYLKKEHCKSLQQPFKKITQMAAELIAECEPPEAVHVRVPFDSYYLCPLSSRPVETRNSILSRHSRAIATYTNRVVSSKQAPAAEICTSVVIRKPIALGNRIGSYSIATSTQAGSRSVA